MIARSVTALLLAGLASGWAVAPLAGAQRIPSHTSAPYIVTLHDTADDAPRTRARRVRGLEHALGFRASLVYRHVFAGFAARLTPHQAARLSRDPAVAAIASDTPVALADTGQQLPTGVDRVQADTSDLADIDGDGSLVDADIAIIDTGIQRDHPDLDVVGGHDCTGSADPSDWDDVAGHGTHVAGIAAARDNGIGVVGVAPGARLWSVRVFDGLGRGYTSWVVCAIDWVAAQRDPADPSRPRIEVANMSLRGLGRDDGACGTIDGDTEHQAVCAAVAAGVTFVVAAGNDRGDAANYIPAGYDEVITVSSLADFDGRPGGLAAESCATSGGPDLDDRFAGYSNRGHDVDLIAPGSCIRSTARGSGYRLDSGTSMASPAVAGAAALYRALHPDASPSAVRRALRAAATLDWFTASDPDGTPDRLLDVARLTGEHDLDVEVPGTAGPVGGDGATVAVPVDLLRAAGYPGTVELSVTGVPAEVEATFDDAVLDGQEVSTRLRLTVPAEAADGRYGLTVTATSADFTRSVGTTLVVDGLPPLVTTPRFAFPVGRAVTDSVPLTVRWTATDAVSGLAIVDLDEALAGGWWRSVPLAAASATSVTRRLDPGPSVRYRVRGRDAAGNWSAFATSAEVMPRLRDSDAAAISYSSGWKTVARESAIGDSARTTTVAGATARTAFAGQAFAWVAGMGPKSGRAEVRIDGETVGIVDLRNRRTRSPRIVFAARWDAPGRHVVELRALGTVSRPRVEVDAILFLRHVAP